MRMREHKKNMAEKNNVRELALEVLLSVERKEGKLNDVLHAQLLKYQYLAKQDRAFLTRLCNGVMEYRINLDYVIDQVSNTPVKKCKPMIRCLLRMGAYQILYLSSVPDSAACNETVKLAKQHGFSRLSGFVNGELRTISRTKDAIVYPDSLKDPIRHLSIVYSIPEWIITQWVMQYGKEIAMQMAKASVEPSPLYVRINEQKISREELLSLLEQEGLRVQTFSPSASLEALIGKELLTRLQDICLTVEGVDYLSRYESFASGYVTVQDASSMLVGLLAEQVLAGRLKEPLEVLDMCAAPGGKTTFLACLSEKLHVISRDVSEQKTERIEENVSRLSLSNVTVQVQDALVKTPEQEQRMDLVLLDAPCSGLGVLGRKKDIAYSVTEGTQKELVALQRKMLLAAAEYPKEQGYLLYSTCTVNEEENKNQIRWFLDQRKDYCLCKEYQLLPGVMPTDGFYVAVCKKKEK